VSSSQVPSLRIAVGTLVRGSVSISYIAILLLATYFLFGSVAYLVFKSNDPWHFGKHSPIAPTSAEPYNPNVTLTLQQTSTRQ
jgi:hypothetical protein